MDLGLLDMILWISDRRVVFLDVSLQSSIALSSFLKSLQKDTVGNQSHVIL